jgi:hypothetical protein
LRTLTKRNFKEVFGGSSSSLQTYATVKRALQIQQGTVSSIMTVKYCWELQAEENKSRRTQHYNPGNKLQFQFHEVSM